MALEHVERAAVAEEISLVVEQSLDHLLRQAWFLTHDENGDELVERGDPPLAEQRRQRGLNPPAAAHRQLLAGTRLKEAGENSTGAIAQLHYFCSSVREAMRRAILSGGRTAQASPASNTARGMPQTAQLASSCARTEPPQATIRDAPSTPSRPMPVRTTPMAPEPKTAPTDPNIGSSDGMQPLSLRPCVSRTTAPSGFGSTVRWASPGAIRMTSGSSAMPSSAMIAGRRATAPNCRAKTPMNGTGKCWVTRIGTPISAGNAWNNAPRAWMPPVEAPIARTSIGSLGIARSAFAEPFFTGAGGGSTEA